MPSWVNPDRPDEFEEEMAALDAQLPSGPYLSRWRAFVLASGPPDSGKGSIATAEWWAANMPTYEGPSQVELEYQALQANGKRAVPKKPWSQRLKVRRMAPICEHCADI